MEEKLVIDRQMGGRDFLFGGLRAACALGGAARTILAINRGCPILHAGPGCSTQILVGQMGQGGRDSGGGCSHQMTIPSSTMREREVVFGGEERLREVVKATIEQFDADFYMVLGGCTAGIVGDDNMAVVNEFRAKGYPIGFADASGFKGSSYIGYEQVINALIDQFLEKSPSTEKGTVNILGIVPSLDIFWRGDLMEIKRILERIGLKVNMLFGEHAGGLEEWKNAPKAEFNIVLSGWAGIEPAKHFEKKLGVPYFIFPGIPIGIEETGRFLRQVGERLGVDKNVVEKVIAEEEKEAFIYLPRVGEEIQWVFSEHYPFALVADSAHAIPMTKFLVNEISLDPQMVIITDVPPLSMREDIKNEIINGLQYGDPPQVIFEEAGYAITEHLLEAEIRVLIGSSAEKQLSAMKHWYHLSVSYPVTDRVIYDRPYAGYRGTLAFCEDYSTALFTRLAT
jgi:nitrogenase molybdenum-iron protein beta chain